MLHLLRTSDRRWTALAVLMTAAFMAILDVSIVFVASPSIADELGASPAQVEWVVAAYGLAFALGLITGGRLGDLLGHRRVFVAGLTVFALGSALCGAAPTASALVAARILQALGSAAMMPQVLSIIQIEFAPRERGRALAIMGAVQGAAFVGGQLIGGGLIQLDVLGLGWRWIFLVNVPVGISGVALAGRFIPQSRAAATRRLDGGGLALSVALLAAVMVPLVEGRSAGWPAWTFLTLAAAVALGAMFIAWERRVGRRGGSPLVALELFGHRPFRLGVALSLLVYAGLPGFFLSTALLLQDGIGLSPLQSGLAFSPAAVAFATTSLGAARLGIAWRERLLAPAAAAAGLGAAAVGLVAASSANASPFAIGALLAVFGAGQGLTIPSLNGTVLATTTPEQAGSASGLLATAQQAGGAFGVAVAGTLFFEAVGGATGGAAYGDGMGAAAAFVAATAAACVALALWLTRAAGAPAEVAVARAGSR